VPTVWLGGRSPLVHAIDASNMNFALLSENAPVETR
jgi:hypothetical protein